jgi:hypothetical protein
MRKLNYVFLLSLMILVIAGCSKLDTQPELPDSSDDITLKKKGMKNFVPFKASFELSVDLESVLMGPNVPTPPDHLLDPQGKPFLKYQKVYGEGKATHLGKTGLELNQWWRPTSPPPPPGGPFNQWGGTGSGYVFFTAANGDLLKAEYKEAVSWHISPTYVTVTFTGNFIDGGTGRFAKAEGWFLWEVEYNPSTNFGTVAATGEVKYSK